MEGEGEVSVGELVDDMSDNVDYVTVAQISDTNGM